MREGYDSYMTSKQWNDKRKHIAEIRHHKCEHCGKIIMQGYHIHHKTYVRFKHERDSDLMFLCEQCHNKLHFISSKSKNNKRKIICPQCLERFNYDTYISNMLYNCPKCGYRIGRPNRFGKLGNGAKLSVQKTNKHKNKKPKK